MRRGFLCLPPKMAAATAASAAATSTGDRLSFLPAEILIDIVSRLPTDEMVRTSILSPRWRRLWTSSPVLHFTRAFSRASPDDLAAVTDRCLRLCSASRNLRSLRLPLFQDPAFPPTLHRWLTFAAARAVEHLTLSPGALGRCRVPVPGALFRCTRLTALRLNGVTILSVPSAAFPHLRTLAFNQVTISDAPLRRLLASCPGLEQLTLSHVREITRLTLRFPGLTHLMIYDCHGLRAVKIHAPDLRRLMYFGDLSVLSLGGFPKLHEAALLSGTICAFKDQLRWREFVSSLANVTLLSVNSWLFQFTCGEDVIFKNLHELHWWPVFKKTFGVPAEPWCAEKGPSYLHCALPFLRDNPSVEKLCIFLEQEDYLYDLGDYYYSDDCPSSDYEIDVLQLYKGAEYMLPRLKTLKITGFSAKKEEMQLVKLLTEKAADLNSVSLDYVAEMSPKLSKIRRELLSSHKAFKTTKVTFTEFDEDKVCPKHEGMWYEFMVL